MFNSVTTVVIGIAIHVHILLNYSQTRLAINKIVRREIIYIPMAENFMSTNVALQG